MYICPPADMVGEPPPGLLRVTDTEHISTTRSSEGSEEPPVNTDVRDRKGNRTGAPSCQPSGEKLTAAV